ncbi:MAG TPA: hypothetical protein VE871_13415 [Longimicrobium sp.]|nr:hypothetical protein [Longimicrobium sp.]
MSHNDSHPSTLPLRMAPASAALVIGGLVLGVLGIALAFLLSGDHPQRALSALHFNWMFWSSVAIGMVMFSVALHLTHARWAWSIKRFSLAGAAFLPVSFVIFPFMLFFGRYVYFHHWIEHDGHNPIHGDAILEAKAAWLSFPGMMVRDIVALAVLYGLALLFTYHQLRPDMHGRGWGNGGDAVAVAEDAYRKNLKIGVFTALAFAFGWGLIGIDLGMTTLPHFFSTMLPVAFFISAFHSAIAMTIVMAVLHRKSLGLEAYITEKQFHDIGKLLFAFAVFWMYINWSQYVVIWYGLLPHEQEYFVRKFNDPFGGYVMAAVMLIFVVPFFGLLPRAIKKMAPILAGFACLVLVGHWLERFLIATPNYWESEQWGPIGIGLPEILMALGFLGLFVASYRLFLQRYPVIPSPVSLNAIPNGLVTFARPSRTTATVAEA